MRVCVCVCVCVGVCVGVGVCVALVPSTQVKSKAVSEAEQVNAARSCSDSYLQILEPTDIYFSSWFCSPNAKCLLFSLNNVC